MLRMFDIRRIFIRVRSSISSNKWLYLAVSVYIIVLSTITILKHHAFLTSGFDLGIFNQAFHTTLFDGKFFYETGDLSFNPGGSFFGVHFSPILFLLLPFYAIYPNPENFLVMQTVILALGAFPIYWMSRDKLGKKVGLMVSIIYFVYPPLFLLNLNDFHLEAFTSTFFLFSVYYFEREEWTKFFALIILTMLTIEFAPIIGVFMALYGLLLYSKNKFKDGKAARKYIVLTALLSVLIFVLAFKIKENFNTYTSPLPTPFHYILSNPAGVPSIFFSDGQEKIFYLINFLAPLASLPLLAPEPLVMAIPWIFVSFSSTYSVYYSVYFQYTGFVIPFVFIAFPKAIERLNLQNARKILYVVLLCTTIFTLYLPFGHGSPWNYQLPTTNERVELIRVILPYIPSNASILTQNDIFPHVSNRAEAYMYMPTLTNASVDYILVDQTSEFYKWYQPAVFGERTPLNVTTLEVDKNGTFGILARAKSVLLLKKGYTGEPELDIPYCFNYSNLILDTGSVREDPSSTSGHVLFHGANDTKGMFWHGPYISLPCGLYNATFVVKVDNTAELNQSDHLFAVDVTAKSGEVLLAKNHTYGIANPPSGGWFNVSLFFGLTEPAEDVEFRGFALGENNVYLDYLVVKQLSLQPVSDRELAFNSWDLNATQVSLPKGNYTAKFWLKRNKTYDAPLTINITSNSGRNPLCQLLVNSSDFENNDVLGGWKGFEVNFPLPNGSKDVKVDLKNIDQSPYVTFLFVEVHTDTRELPEWCQIWLKR
jgi:uncharacterized membrane protein